LTTNNDKEKRTSRFLKEQKKLRKKREERKYMKNKIEKFVEAYLEDYTFEELLEEFDITPVDAFLVLFDNGLVDEEIIEEYVLVHL
jgi:hypothetical protein